MILTLKETGLRCCFFLDPLYRGQVRTREAQECWVVLGSHEMENGHLWLEVSGGGIHRVLEKQRSCAGETDQIHLSGKREEHWDEEGSELYSREDSESCTTFSLSLSLSPLQKLSIITVIQADWLTVETQRALTLSHSELIFIFSPHIWFQFRHFVPRCLRMSLFPYQIFREFSESLPVSIYISHSIYLSLYYTIALSICCSIYVTLSYRTLSACHSIYQPLYLHIVLCCSVYHAISDTLSTNHSICSHSLSLYLLCYLMFYLHIALCRSIYPSVTLYTYHAVSLSDTLFI